MTVEQSAFAISVIIATYNRSRRVLALLDDLRKQHLGSEKLFEVIIINDGSKDETERVLTAYAQLFEALGSCANLAVFHQANTGQAIARQNGAQAARGKVLVFLDDDMRLPDEDFLAAHLGHHCVVEAGLSPVVVLGSIVPPEDDPPRKAFEYFYERSLARMYARFQGGEQVPGGQNFFTGNASVPRALFFAAGGFASAYRHGEDKELGLRLEMRTSAKFVFEPKARSIHHSDTPSFRSFAHRAHLYGYFDVEMQKVYPDRTDIGPAGTLVQSGVFRYLLKECFFSLPASRQFTTRVCSALAMCAGKLGSKRLASLFCSLVYLANYIGGALENTGNAGRPPLDALCLRHWVMHVQKPKSGFATGKSLWRDLGRDADLILAYETKPKNLKSWLWLLFGIDAWLILVLFRLRKSCVRRGIPFFNRFFRGLSSALYGIELGIDVEIGHGVYFVHPHGVVVGGDARVAEGVVFMGSNTVGTAKNNGYPCIGRFAILGAGARVLGPIEVGSGCVIGANAVVVGSIPSGSVAVGIPARVAGGSPHGFHS